MAKRLINLILGTVYSLLAFPIMLLLALIGRVKPKDVDVGLGPHPLINNIYHKRALERFGYKALTFVFKPYFITRDFDVNLEERLAFLPRHLTRLISSFYIYCIIVLRCRAIYIYFNGGPLAVIPGFLPWVEAFLYKCAGVKVVVMPYGGDVQDMAQSRNLYFRHTMTISYPEHYRSRPVVERSIRYWSENADHVLSGVEWVDYMYHWDTLMLAHFSFDTERTQYAPHEFYEPGCGRALRILHAPNHRMLKGTSFVVDAVNSLQKKGYDIELTMIEKRPNEEVIAAIKHSDLVVDQLVIGWYAMFAIESMAIGRPTVCYVRPDLEDLYVRAGLLEPAEIPFISAGVIEFETTLIDILEGKIDLADHSRRGRDYVVKHHSLEAIGTVFDRINREIGVSPSED